MAVDPYTTLGVKKDATQNDIQKAYRRLAKKLHPDLNPGDSVRARRFREIVAAYDLVSDEARRRQYDRDAELARTASDHRVEPRSGFDDGLDSFFRTRGWGFKRADRPAASTATGRRRASSDTRS